MWWTKKCCFCPPYYIISYFCIVLNECFMKITLSLSDKINRTTEESEIMLRCSMGRTCRLRAKSGIFIAPKFWDKKNNEIKSTNRIQTAEVIKANKVRIALDGLCKRIEEESIKIPPEDITREWLANVIDEYNHPESHVKAAEIPFFEVLDKFIETEKKDSNWKATTAERFITLRHHLTSYEDERCVSISFDKLNKEFFDDFAEFLLKTKEMRNSTNAKNLKLLKWFLRWATLNGYNNNTFFEMYTPGMCKTKSTKAEKKVIVFLNEEELKTVRDFDFSNDERLDKVRDVFVFCCYSGLRYSDVEHLTQNNVYDDMLHVTTIKTDDTITINLNNTTRKILEKYHNEDNPKAKALPVITNQKMNLYLKEMAKICGIDQPITKTYYVGSQRVEETRPKYEWIGTHTGRRTFICNALSKGIAPQMVMKFTGHSDYKAMRPYIDITENAKANAMKLLDD